MGSSNFGYRSVVRDLEAGFLVVTRNPVLRQACTYHRAEGSVQCVRFSCSSQGLRGYRHVGADVFQLMPAAGGQPFLHAGGFMHGLCSDTTPNAPVPEPL